MKYTIRNEIDHSMGRISWCAFEHTETPDIKKRLQDTNALTQVGCEFKLKMILIERRAMKERLNGFVQKAYEIEL